MADYTKAAEELKWLAVKFAGVLGIADELTKVGSLQQAADEANQRVLGLKAEQERLEAEVAIRQKEVAASMEQSAALMREFEGTKRAALDSIAKIRDDAVAERMALLVAARDEAGTILADTRAHAKGMSDAARADLQGVFNEISNAESTLAVIKDDVRKAQGVLDGMNASIEAFKRKFGT